MLNAIIERYEAFQPDPDWIHLMENQTNIEVPPLLPRCLSNEIAYYLERCPQHFTSSAHLGAVAALQKGGRWSHFSRWVYWYTVRGVPA